MVDLKKIPLIIFGVLLFYLCSCSSGNIAKKQISNEPQKEYAKANIKRLDNPTAENLNSSWKKNYTDATFKEFNDSLNKLFPNPFCPTTTFKWWAVDRDTFTIYLLDKNKTLIDTLYHGLIDSGIYECRFGDNNLSSGIYYYLLQKRQEKYYQKVIWMK